LANGLLPVLGEKVAEPDEGASMLRKPETKSTEHTLKHARRLRQDMTGPERILWGELRGKRFAGWTFRRQAPLGHYIVDFLCRPIRLVIEIDGDSHIGRFEQDQSRQEWLHSQGYSVVRFSNDDVLKELDSVLAAIERILPHP
jgi:very-short-patch-repair endonuclease